MATSPMAEVEGVVPGAKGVLKRRDLEGRRKDHYNNYFVHCMANQLMTTVSP